MKDLQQLFTIRNLFQLTGFALLVLGLQACTQPLVMPSVVIEKPVEVEKARPGEHKTDMQEDVQLRMNPGKEVALDVEVPKCEIVDYLYKETFVIDAWAVPDNNFSIGEPLTLQMRVSAPAYVSVFYVDTSCKVTRLLDNTLIKVNELVNFPLKESGIRMVVKPPEGEEGFYFIATREKFNFLSRTDILGGEGDIVSLDMSPEQFYSRLDQARSRIAPTNWSSWTLRTNVRTH